MDELSDYLNFLKGVTGIIKERAFFERLEKIHQSGLETIKSIARANRLKQSTIIIAIQNIDFTLEQIKFQYERIKRDCVSEGIASIDAYISEIENQRKRLVFMKKK